MNFRNPPAMGDFLFLYNMIMFPFTQIENKNYPSIIMGEDRFTGWFYKSETNYKTEELRAKAYYESIDIAYQLGVRGFSMSPHPTLIEVLNNFKKDHSDIVCIANPHFQKNYYLNNESLWTSDNLGRLAATIYNRYSKELKNINWFREIDKYQPFSYEEINNFSLNTNEYSNNLNIFNQFCDFSLIGNLHRSALLLLNRQDLVIKESELVRKAGMIPILMCEAGVLAIEKGKNIDCGAYWIMMNEELGVPNISELIEYIKTVNKPITAYKAFTRSDGFNAKKTIKFFNKVDQVKSLVVGVENSDQAEETFSLLNKLI